MQDSTRPSKQFLLRGGIAIGIVAIILLVQTAWFHILLHKIFYGKPAAPAVTTPETVGDIVSKDSNGNGIPDWQEVLWGLDPTVLYTNGKSNADIIKEKKAALGVTNDATGTPTNQTDAIAQQLFGITTALSQNDNVDDATLQGIADKLGSSVDVASISNRYSLKDIHTVPTSTASLTAYYNNLNTIVSKDNQNQQDISVIVNASETGDYSQLPQLIPIGVAYLDIAQKLSVVKVPIGVAQYDLDIINSFYGMATSFTYLQKMEDDGTEALVGVALYQVYGTRGETAFANLHVYLIKYGILTS